ncbi:hypothetical protein ROJ8625_04046 [Roseivivax jejudonensis]|uniref:DUF3047 domain-containing protein n=1 Tax=Roseivivax jejudonensis TaxID=1529041 RepID=A0A1X7AAH8_9RHOB|nr:DUF3047 domain-containing protein [Roseivivax jejudonensis]SLN74360.1 hypothetical protein ROJ8625_04046 [Roseivivax jejudonensis]
MRLPSILLCLAALAPAAAALAGSVPFDAGWKTQRLTLFGPSNDYTFEGDAVRVVSEDSVSLAYRELDPGLADARAARWRWQVSEGVAATDLAQKGGDDRNIAVYFMFVPEDRAAELRGSNVVSLLDEDSARVLVYVWGGAHEAGQMLESPYLGARGRTVVLRPAGTGDAEEAVDLAADHARAFGGAPGALVGVAVSADSDDTDGRIDAQLSDLRIE